MVGSKRRSLYISLDSQLKSCFGVACSTQRHCQSVAQRIIKNEPHSFTVYVGLRPGAELEAATLVNLRCRMQLPLCSSHAVHSGSFMIFNTRRTSPFFVLFML
uniref:Uncharacterized protein n=1 Tax=Lotharella globosa TaxID=91324 RepID=A0A7S3Z7T4_9EUKA